MPSPTCRIPISLDSSAWFQPVDGAQARAFIPPSIRPGEVATLDDSLKVFIRRNESLTAPDMQFFEQDVLSVSAYMPWLNRTLPNFEYSCLIDIQYPVIIQSIDYLKSLAQGSESCFTFEVSPMFMITARNPNRDCIRYTTKALVP